MQHAATVAPGHRGGRAGRAPGRTPCAGGTSRPRTWVAVTLRGTLDAVDGEGSPPGDPAREVLTPDLGRVLDVMPDDITIIGPSGVVL